MMPPGDGPGGHKSIKEKLIVFKRKIFYTWGLISKTLKPTDLYFAQFLGKSTKKPGERSSRVRRAAVEIVVPWPRNRKWLGRS